MRPRVFTQAISPPDAMVVKTNLLNPDGVEEIAPINKHWLCGLGTHLAVETLEVEVGKLPPLCNQNHSVAPVRCAVFICRIRYRPVRTQLARRWDSYGIKDAHLGAR